MAERIYNYIHNLRLNSIRQNFIIQQRRIDKGKGDGSKTLGWIMFDNSNNLIFENKNFDNVIEFKRKIENV